MCCVPLSPAPHASFRSPLPAFLAFILVRAVLWQHPRLTQTGEGRCPLGHPPRQLPAFSLP